jgi:starch phosphorylase
VRWIDKVRLSLRTLGPRVTAERMLHEYVDRLYEPASVST